MGSARDIMPLDLAVFLLETHHLTPLATSAYIHLQIHYWRHGALPVEEESLAAIAQLPMHAWSNAQASLKHLFSIGPDGLYHQAGLDRRRADWIGKHQRAKEKARKAANARWAKYWAKKAEHAQDVMHAQAAPSIENGSPPPSLAGFPHTPFLEPIHPPLAGGVPPATPLGTDTRAGVMSVPAQIGDAISRPVAELGGLQGVPWLLPEASDLAPAAARNGVNKAKRGNFGSTASANVGNGIFPHPAAAASYKVPLRVSARHFKKLSDLRFGTEPADPRFGLFGEEIFAYWSAQNPGRGKCPWTPADKGALAGLLKGAPDMTLEEFKRLLCNRAASSLNPAALPRNWVGHIQEFSDGPLDRFKRPARPARLL